MICPKCYSEIYDDSSFCDMCGIKIMLCPACGILGYEKKCRVDHSKMIEKGNNVIEKKLFKTERFISDNKAISILLINKNLNVEFKISPGDVVGRKSESLSKELGHIKQISSKHALFEFNNSNGWFVSDLNTTNGTKVNGVRLEIMTPVKIKQGDTLTLANIEFFVSS